MEKTIKNLAAASVGESQARNRYTFYAKIAKKEGYEQISELFLLTAENEREHAKWLLVMINNLLCESEEKTEPLMVEAEVPTVMGTTLENLRAAIAGESYENSTMYPEFAKIAKEEGLDQIAERLLSIAKAEKHHEERYQELLNQLEKKTIFQKESEIEWVCRKCGYMHSGKTPPEKSPSCDHPTSYFEVKCERY